MFNLTVAQYKEHDLAFVLDEDDNFWFIIRHTASGNNVDAVAFHQFDYFLNHSHGGNIDAFFDNEIIPKSTALVRSYFGKDSGAPIDPDDWRAQLEQMVRGVQFDSSDDGFGFKRN